MWWSRNVLMIMLALLGTQACEQKPLYRQEITGPFLFAVDSLNQGIEAKWYRGEFDRSGWRPVDIGRPWDGDGLQNYDGAGWYFCAFDVEPVAEPKFALEISSVDDNAQVWVNDKFIGVHRGANSRFVFDVTVPVHQGRNYLAVRVEDNGGPGGLNGTVALQQFKNFAAVLSGPYTKFNARPNADWVKQAVIYEVYLRSFSPEGTFAGLQQQLQSLRDLGVTVLWLMPIHPVGAEKRKGTLGSPYSIKDYYGINPELGTLDDFKKLVAAVHAHGMKIIIDLVANHTAWDNGMLETHPEWYTHDDSGDIVPPVADWSDVADLDYDNPALRSYMIEMMTYWVRDIDLDGYRCDVAEMVPLDFWETARAALDKIKPVLMLAEGSDPALHLKAFDLTYSWKTYKALAELAENPMAAALVKTAEIGETNSFPKNSRLLRFTSNHDENAWRAPAMTLYGPAGAKAAAVVAFCEPGVPLLYNGQEVGNTTPLPLFEKVAIDWQTDPHDMRGFYRELLKIRRESAALQAGKLTWVEHSAADKVLVFCRDTEKQRVLVAVNLSATPQQIQLPEHAYKSTRRFGDGEFDRDTLSLPAYGYYLGAYQ